MPQLLDPELIAWIHVASTWFMVGLVWFVQCVHYPLLQDLPPELVPTYQQAHIRRTFPLIPLVMLTEAITSLLLFRDAEPLPNLWLANLLCLGAIWVLTFLVIVPLHQKLIAGFHPQTFRALLRMNAVRSILWLAHGIISILLLKQRVL